MNSEGYKDPTAGINRNILECKFRSFDFQSWLFTVLIETYWNVNVTTSRLRVITGRVLIETYWNVNDTKPDTKPY